MIFLILDTNIWLYLANGLDPIASTEKFHDSFHFKLLQDLVMLVDNKEVCILSNNVILQEWQRNKQECLRKIEKLKNKLKNPGQSFKDIEKYTNIDSKELLKKYIVGIEKDIKRNEKHIKEVEKFLKKKCLKVPILQKTKLLVYNLAISQTPPFHNKKNNIADAAILFSAIEYLKNKIEYDEKAFFVSNNYTEYTNSKNKKDFHPLIKPNLQEVDISYQRVLPKALAISRKVITQIEELRIQEEYLESISFTCLTPYCESNRDYRPWGYLDGKIKVKSVMALDFDPNQIELFEDLPISAGTIMKETNIGSCIRCETLHVICPNCNGFTYLENNPYMEHDSGENHCIECDARILIEFDEYEKQNCLFIEEISIEE